MIDKVYKFKIEGRPRSQKNNINIYKRGKTSFVGHSKDFSEIRNDICDELYKQFKDQGGTDPIDYHVEVQYRFFHRRQWEPDLDNLPAVILDAIQGRKIEVKDEKGKKVKNEKGKVVKEKINITLKDDKLVRFQKEEKIISTDDKYSDPERTEFTIRRYYPEKDYFKED